MRALNPRNAGRGPVSVATAPTAGPAQAPALAAANARPINRPRSPGRPSVSSHGIEPAQTAAAPAPVTSRAASSTPTCRPMPNAAQDTPIITRPPSETRREPMAPTREPAGTAAIPYPIA